MYFLFLYFCDERKFLSTKMDRVVTLDLYLITYTKSVRDSSKTNMKAKTKMSLKEPTGKYFCHLEVSKHFFERGYRKALTVKLKIVILNFIEI